MTDDESIPHVHPAQARHETGAGRPAPTPRPAPTGALSTWQWVIVAAAVPLPLVLAAAGAGVVFMNPIGGEAPELAAAGTAAWLASGLLLGIPQMLAPGPARGVRVVVGLAVGAAWFAVGRFLLP